MRTQKPKLPKAPKEGLFGGRPELLRAPARGAFPKGLGGLSGPAKARRGKRKV